jgi:hypothetical protein
MGRVQSALEGDAMSGPIGSLLAAEHRHLERMFEKATADPERIDVEKYARFRAGLLKHIAAEEKTLIPAAKAASAEILPLARKIVRSTARSRRC